MARVYATRVDLVDAAPEGIIVPADPEATRKLKAASSLIERATMAAIYATDSSGYPTDTAIREAFKDACCAQALWWIDNAGEESGTDQQYQSVGIGSVTLSRGSGLTGGVPGQRLAPQADSYLRNAGVLPGSVVHYGAQEWGW